MPTISNPPVGAVAYGRSGVGHVIAALKADRVILKTSDGLKRVPLEAVVRWELPAFPVGSVVHKRRSDGWTGQVVAVLSPEAAEVLWCLDLHPALMAVSELRPADTWLADTYKKHAQKGDLN